MVVLAGLANHPAPGLDKVTLSSFDRQLRSVISSIGGDGFVTLQND